MHGVDRARGGNGLVVGEYHAELLAAKLDPEIPIRQQGKSEPGDGRGRERIRVARKEAAGDADDPVQEC